MMISVRTVGPFQENCYLIHDKATNRAVMIDPGDDAPELLGMLRDSGATLEAIWCTHAHIDHIGAIAEITRRLDVPVWLHAADLPFYTTLSAKAAEMYGIEFEQPEGPDADLADGQLVTCGELSFVVMHVPGHAPGLVSFNGHGVAIAGDLLFKGSIGRTDLPLSDPFAMEASLERFATLAADTVVYPGHGPPTTLAVELRTNPFLAGRARTVKR